MAETSNFDQFGFLLEGSNLIHLDSDKLSSEENEQREERWRYIMSKWGVIPTMNNNNHNNNNNNSDNNDNNKGDTDLNSHTSWVNWMVDMLCKEGIPHSLRAEAWKLMLSVPTAIASHPKSYYSSLVVPPLTKSQPANTTFESVSSSSSPSKKEQFYSISGSESKEEEEEDTDRNDDSNDSDDNDDSNTSLDSSFSSVSSTSYSSTTNTTTDTSTEIPVSTLIDTPESPKTLLSLKSENNNNNNNNNAPTPAIIDNPNNIIQVQEGVTPTKETILQLSPQEKVIIEQILLDIPRTYPNHVSFGASLPQLPDDLSFIFSSSNASRYHPSELPFQTPAQRHLYDILRAYSTHNRNVGYCQGMSFIAGVFLVVIKDPEESFWALCSLLDRGMGGYYLPRMPQLVYHAKVFGKMIEQNLPKLASHLAKIGLEPLVYVTPWWMCLFTTHPYWECVMRIWDLFVFEGLPGIFRVSLSMMTMCEKALLKMSGTEEALPFLLRPPIQKFGAAKRLFEIASTIDIEKIMHNAMSAVASAEFNMAVQSIHETSSSITQQPPQTQTKTKENTTPLKKRKDHPLDNSLITPCSPPKKSFLGRLIDSISTPSINNNNNNNNTQTHFTHTPNTTVKSLKRVSGRPRPVLTRKSIYTPIQEGLSPPALFSPLSPENSPSTPLQLNTKTFNTPSSPFITTLSPISSSRLLIQTTNRRGPLPSSTPISIPISTHKSLVLGEGNEQKVCATTTRLESQSPQTFHFLNTNKENDNTLLNTPPPRKQNVNYTLEEKRFIKELNTPKNPHRKPLSPQSIQSGIEKERKETRRPRNISDGSHNIINNNKMASKIENSAPQIHLSSLSGNFFIGDFAQQTPYTPSRHLQELLLLSDSEEEQDHSNENNKMIEMRTLKSLPNNPTSSSIYSPPSSPTSLSSLRHSTGYLIRKNI